MTIGIIGNGWVGKAVHKLFPDAVVHSRTEPNLLAFEADYVFICVPTPLLESGVLDCSIVRDSIEKCSKESVIIVRSTVNPGFCDSLDRDVCFQPEYLGETANHPLLDEKKTQFIILGGKPNIRRKVIELYQKVYNANITIRQVTNYEAEVIKLSENRAIAFKVLQCQELYDACEKHGVDYYTIRDAVYGDDPRFNLWFSFIYPGNRSITSSKCLQKDVPAWTAWADTQLTKDLLKYDETLRQKT